MDFRHHQSLHRRRSLWLLASFCAAVAATVAGVNLLTYIGWLWFAAPPHSAPFTTFSWLLWLQHPLCWISVATTLAVILLGSALRLMELRGGGVAVALMMGGREIQRSSGDEHERRLLNVVDEMAIAASQLPPRLFVIDRERALNAFVAGTSPANSALVVTEGLLATLSRDQLQGVVAHEFGHILQGDVALTTRLIGYLAGILMISRIGRFLVRLNVGNGEVRSRRDGRIAIPLLLLGLALWLVGWIGWIGGRLIQAAVSRQREYLADATAVQLTRQTEGLAGALKQILEHPLGGRLLHIKASEVSHLCIANSLHGQSWLATHPPLDARIRKLQPWFRLLRRQQHQPTSKAPQPTPAVSAENGAQQMLSSLQQQCGDALQQPELAASELLVLLALAQRQPQQALALIGGSDEQQLTLDLQRQKLADLSEAQRLPLLQLLIATARQLPLASQQQLTRQLLQVVDSDGDHDLFDLLALALWQQHAQPSPAPAPIHRYQQVEAELLLLFSLLAHSGHGDPQAAFQLAASGFKLTTDQPLAPAAFSGERISSALQRLSGLHPLLRQPLFDACRETAMADGHQSPAEQQLLTLLALVLQLPPPR
ncbi:MAG: M48 family metalloprotease [Gammaproteobacteria bacterium]|nr:M48 family metalloprotease [Gammaproteobacteria bacterium]